MTTATASTPSNAAPRKASYAGRCAHCRASFPVGTPILWAPGFTAHQSCPTAEEVAAAPVVAEPVRATVRVAPLLAALAAAREALNVAGLWEVRKVALAARDAALAAAGLCPDCKGEGWYEVRWSMDCGCVDHVTCACNKDGKVTRGVAALRAAHPEVEAACAAYDAAHDAVRRAEVEEKALTRREETLSSVERFTVVEVVRGRKVAKGTVGTVIWVGEGRSYSPYARRYSNPWFRSSPPARIGVKDAEGNVHWTAASNVEVVEVAATVAAAAGF
jgi:hypothetical protein